MPTPHNNAEIGAIATTVLMPGDPLRAKFIAEQYLEGAVEVNSVRGMLAYTGTYQGKPVSVMGSGMGMPSIGIYSYELYKFYGVENIIRVGSSISFAEEIGLMDVVLGTASCSQSTFAKTQCGSDSEVQYPSEILNQRLEQSAEKLGVKIFKGPISSSDVFYYEDSAAPAADQFVKKHGCVCGEMESFALFSNAKALGKNAATIVTISDSAFFKEESTPEQRQTGFHQMIQIALGAI